MSYSSIRRGGGLLEPPIKAFCVNQSLSAVKFFNDAALFFAEEKLFASTEELNLVQFSFCFKIHLLTKVI